MIQVLVTIVGVLAVAVAVVGLVSRYAPIRSNGLLVVVAASPYLMAAGPVGTILLGLGRQWVLTVLAACLSVVIIGVQLPHYIGTKTGAVPDATVRVMSANLLYGRADPRVVVELARDSADVLVVQEMTPQLAKGMSAAGLDDTFPHRVIDPRPRGEGIRSGAGIRSACPPLSAATCCRC